MFYRLHLLVYVEHVTKILIMHIVVLSGLSGPQQYDESWKPPRDTNESNQHEQV